MNTYVKVAAGFAAAIIIVFAAWQLLPRNSSIGGPPTPSPSASGARSEAPSESPVSPAPVFPAWLIDPRCAPNCAGILSPGAHESRFLDPQIGFFVPRGWVNDADWPYLYSIFPDTRSNADEFARSADVDQVIRIGGLSREWADDWGICPGTVEPPAVVTAQAIADALTGSPNLVTSEPIPSEMGGLEGYVIDVHLDPEWTGTCPLDPEDPRDKDFTDIRHRQYVLDLPGGGVVSIYVESLHSSEWLVFLNEASPIVESFQFVVRPTAT